MIKPYTAVGLIPTVRGIRTRKDIQINLEHLRHLVKAAVGDTIRFQPTNPSHNAETMANMLPAGATPMKGAMNKEAVLTVTKPGLYGIKCMPHYSMGMVALVQVGKVTPADLAAAKAVKLPPFAAKRMTAALAKVK